MHSPVHAFRLITLLYFTSLFFSVVASNVTKNEEETSLQLARKRGDKEEKGMMGKLLPLMVIPFMVSTAIIPMMLVSLKFMLVKSALIGKLAVILLVLNMFRNRATGEGGVFTHNVDMKDMSMAHYGYSGGEEYGAYVNGRTFS